MTVSVDIFDVADATDENTGKIDTNAGQISLNISAISEAATAAATAMEDVAKLTTEMSAMEETLKQRIVALEEKVEDLENGDSVTRNEVIVENKAGDKTATLRFNDDNEFILMVDDDITVLMDKDGHLVTAGTVVATRPKDETEDA